MKYFWFIPQANEYKLFFHNCNFYSKVLAIYRTSSDTASCLAKLCVVPKRNKNNSTAARYRH